MRPFARNNALDEVVRLSSEGVIRLVAQPPLTGPLADGRYFVDAAWVTGATFDNPSTHVVRTGVRPLSGSVSLTGFVGLPEGRCELTGTGSRHRHVDSVDVTIA